jgi:hypothetical protein
VVDDWGTATGGGEPPPRPPGGGGWWDEPTRAHDDAAEPEAPLPGWMRRAPSADFGSRGEGLRGRSRHFVDKARRRTPLNAPVYAYVQRVEEKPSFWSAGKGVLLGTGFAAGSLALALTLVALVRTDPDDAMTDPDGGVAIAGDPTTSLPGDFDDGKIPLEAPTPGGASTSTTTTTTDGSTTTDPPTTVEVTAPPTTPTTVAPTTPPTTAPTTTTQPTTTRQPAPAITSLRAERRSGFCRDRDEIRVLFSWTTTNATSAQFGRQGRSSSSVGTNDDREDCVDRGSTWVLSVSGPGGTDNQAVTAS